MTFYVKKSLAHGPIRFGVSPRHTIEEIDSDPAVSTGVSGEFVRRSTHGYFFADSYPIGVVEIPKPSSIASTSFFSALKPADAKGWGFVAMMIVGAILLLLGIGTIMRLGPQGWIPVILGLALLSTPLGITAQKRRAIRAQEEKDRAEREEREKRNREAMTAYTTALERLRADPSEENMKIALREREQLELSYKIWRPVAKRTVLHIGFAALGRLSAKSSDEISRLMERVAAAAGLDKPDTLDVKLDLYQTVVWHLLADDRVGPTQTRELDAIRRGLGLSDSDTSDESFAMQQFDRLRGITREKLPEHDCPIPLGYRETCIHSTRGQIHGAKKAEDCTLYLTNKRVILDGRKKRELPLPRVDDVDVDVNANVMTIQVARPDPALQLTVEQPLYTAALIDIATTLDERPKSFA